MKRGVPFLVYTMNSLKGYLCSIDRVPEASDVSSVARGSLDLNIE